jgi:hypothetical protein
MNLGDLIRLANSATESAAEARKQALPATVTACRLIESAVQEMLAGEPLRGLKNLGIAGETFYGARVRTKPDTKVDHFNDCLLIDEEGHSADTFLILDAQGRLTYLQWILDDQVEPPYWTLVGHPVPDDYFRIGDVDGLLRALRIVLPRHVKASNRTTASYRGAKALASRIQAALASQGE